MGEGLGSEGDFLGLLRADDGTLLWCDGSGMGADTVVTGPPSGLGAVLAAALAALPQGRCLLFARSEAARALAALSESLLPPICTDSCLFYRRHVVDPDFGGRPADEDGPRLATLLSAPGTRAAVIGNQGVLTLGPDVAQALSDLHRFDRAAGTYLRTRATGLALRLLPDELVESQPEPDAQAFYAAVKARLGD